MVWKTPGMDTLTGCGTAEAANNAFSVRFLLMLHKLVGLSGPTAVETALFGGMSIGTRHSDN